MQSIDKDKTYSLNEIVKAALVPGAKSYPTLHAEVLRDTAKPARQRVLKAIIFGEGKGTTIRIKGSNLLEYINLRKEQGYVYNDKPSPLKGKKRPNITAEKSPNWKGEKVGYDALHNWIRKNKKYPEKCEHCNKPDENLEWANKDHKYRRVLKDYMALCTKCHGKYDKQLVDNK